MHCEGYMLVTKDIRRSREFYEAVLGVRAVLVLERHVVFREGFSLLQEDDWRNFAALGEKPCSYGHHTGQLVFESDDIEAFMHKLAQFPAISLLHPLKEHPWGRRAVRFHDPDGHVIEVGESMRLVVKRFLRSGLTLAQTAERSEFPLDYVQSCLDELREEESEKEEEEEAANQGSHDQLGRC